MPQILCEDEPDPLLIS